MHDKTIGWEERFDKDFAYERDGRWIHWTKSYDDEDNLIHENIPAYMVPDALKSFIASELATQNEEHQILMKEQYIDAKKQEQTRIVKILEKSKVACLGNPEMMLGIQDQTKNKTLDEAITLITKDNA